MGKRWDRVAVSWEICEEKGIIKYIDLHQTLHCVLLRTFLQESCHNLSLVSNSDAICDSLGP